MCIALCNPPVCTFEEIAQHPFDLIFLDLLLGVDNGLDYIPQIVRDNPWTRIIVITAIASVDFALEAMKRGATDYLTKPFEVPQVILVTQSVARRRQLEQRVQTLQAELAALDGTTDFQTATPSMMQVVETARQVSRSQANLLIRGERGTGKGRLARAVHAWSDQAAGPFAAVICRHESADELEIELFGAAVNLSMPGPASGLGAAQSGSVPFCDKGILLLEEVGQLPMRLQPRLVQLLEDREYERQDESGRRPSDVRIIATTTTDLRSAVAQGTFREDLLLALDVIAIEIPPLRKRPNDIHLLAERFVAFFARQNHKQTVGLTPDAIHLLMRHSWPGNVRELRNVIERAVLICKGWTVGVADLPANLVTSQPSISIGDLVPLENVELMHIRQVVATTRSLRRAASVLGIDSSTLWRRMKRSRGQDQPAA